MQFVYFIHPIKLSLSLHNNVFVATKKMGNLLGVSMFIFKFNVIKTFFFCLQKKTLIDKLEEIDNEIEKSEIDRRNIETKRKRVARKIIVFSSCGYLAISLILYAHYRIIRSSRVTYIKYLALPPIL